MSEPLFLLVFAALLVLYMAAVAVDAVAYAVGSVVPGQRTAAENAALLVLLYVAWRRWRARHGDAQ